MEEINLKIDKVTVEAKERKLECPKWTFPYLILWRIERFIRRIINKPAPMVPWKFSIVEPLVCYYSKEVIDELEKDIIDEALKRR